jgi:hypothetical protein
MTQTAKIVMGPEELILEANLYPITFSTLSAIKHYNSAVSNAIEKANKEVRLAESARDKTLEEALNKLKGELN